MSQRQIQHRNIRKLSRVGGGTSYSLTIPIEMIRALRWQESQKVVVELDKDRKKIIIADWE